MEFKQPVRLKIGPAVDQIDVDLLNLDLSKTRRSYNMPFGNGKKFVNYQGSLWLVEIFDKQFR